MTTPPLHHIATHECNKCGKRMIPCVFGHPDDDTFHMAKLGRVKLMGCIIRDLNPPTHWCPYCKAYHRHGERE